MYTAARFINSVHCTNVLSGMLPFFIRSAFVHDTPDPGNDQATAGKAVSRVSDPSVVLTEPPSLRDPASLQGCDWTGVSLSSLWVMAKSRAARYFESVKIGSPPFNRSLPLGRSWRTAAHAYAHRNHKEKVFGEWVFGCQGAIPFSPHKGKQGKSFFVLSPCSP